MSFLLKKSKHNLDASDVLLNSHQLSAPAIHCAYYSCVQLIIHIVIYDLGHRETEILTQAKLNNGGTHNFTQNIVCQDIKLSKNEAKLAFEFNNLFGKLKTKREHADYKDFEVTTPYCKDAFKLATDIRKILLGLYPQEIE